MGDTFFNKSRMIVSTPKRNDELFHSAYDDNTLIESLKNFSLSAIDAVSPVRMETVENKEQNGEVSELQNTVIRVETMEPKTRNQEQKPQSNIVLPFKFDARQKCEEKNKIERLKKTMEREKQQKAFQANPIPKYLKARLLYNNNNDNYNHNHNNNGEGTKRNAANKENNPQQTDKPIKKNAELWKKPPFVPTLSRKDLNRPETPPLRTMIRAKERKRFDATIKEKEMQLEERRRMQIAAKKREEEKEIALLRKQTVHKAQPIRKYKLGLPEVRKRPLTNPLSPLTLKRRRINTENVIQTVNINNHV